MHREELKAAEKFFGIAAGTTDFWSVRDAVVVAGHRLRLAILVPVSNPASYHLHATAQTVLREWSAAGLALWGGCVMNISMAYLGKVTLMISQGTRAAELRRENAAMMLVREAEEQLQRSAAALVKAKLALIELQSPKKAPKTNVA